MDPKAQKARHGADARFRKRERMLRRADFDRLMSNKSTAADDLFVVHVAPNGLDRSRLGISVAKRVGPAVIRNRIRRRIREAFRTSKHQLPEGFDIFCIARAGAAEPGRDIGRSLRTLAGTAARRCRTRR